MLAGGPVTMCVCACVCSGINMLTRDPVTIRVCARVHVCAFRSSFTVSKKHVGNTHQTPCRDNKRVCCALLHC